MADKSGKSAATNGVSFTLQSDNNQADEDLIIQATAAGNSIKNQSKSVEQQPPQNIAADILKERSQELDSDYQNKILANNNNDQTVTSDGQDNINDSSKISPTLPIGNEQWQGFNQQPPQLLPMEGLPISVSHAELDRELFSLFDQDGSGYIELNDLEGIGRAMGWTPQQVKELIYAIDPNHDGKVSYDEFLLILKHIEERLQQSTFSQNNQSRMSNNNNLLLFGGLNQSSRFLSETDRKMYDALLPKQGVYFLPDEKLIAFLKVVNELRKKCEREGEYGKAKRLRDRFEELRSVEAGRQTENMRIAQEQELSTIEGAQKMQFNEFNDAWDKYMADYESAAFESVEQLKEKHIQDIAELSQRIIEEANIKNRWSKDLLDLRRQEKIFFTVKEYDKAEQTRAKADKLEEKERESNQQQVSDELLKQERLLRKKQQMALATLLKRIQRDREEQLKHRFEDAQRLMKRNANLLKDMLKKQTQEQRKTGQFLRYALGTREIKTDGEIMKDLKARVYQPQNDPLMPRIAKKYQQKTGTSQSNYSIQTMNRNSTFLNGSSNRLFSQDSSNIFKQSARNQLGLSPTTTLISPIKAPSTQFANNYNDVQPLNLILQKTNTSSPNFKFQHQPQSTILLNSKSSSLKAHMYQNKLLQNQMHESVIRQGVDHLVDNLPLMKKMYTDNNSMIESFYQDKGFVQQSMQNNSIQKQSVSLSKR